MWSLLKQTILEGLNVFYGLTGDYGFAIVLLTATIRVLMMPLTLKQTKSMLEMQRIQPKIKELQKKYKNDKEKLQEETLKFYQENKVNPLAGCLPLLLQMPVLFALFGVLNADLPKVIEKLPVAQQAAAKAFWIILPDLTASPQRVFGSDGLVAAIAYVVLVVAFALSVWLPQAMMPGEKQQKQIGAYMSIMMLYFGWITPAGVLVYWVTSSVWQIVQQWATMKVLARAEGA